MATRYSQPQIGPAQTLDRLGITSVLLPPVGNIGKCLDGPDFAVTGTLSTAIDGDGVDIRNTAAGNYLSRTAPYTTGGLTVGLVFTPSTITGAEGIWSRATTPTSSGPAILLQRNGADIRVHWGGSYQITFTAVCAIGVPLSIVLSQTVIDRAVVSATISLAINGIVQTVTANNNANSGATEYLLSGYSAAAKGDLNLYWCAPKAFAAQEVKRLSDNPWSIFKTPERWIWGSSGAGGSADLAGAAQAVASASGLLSISVPLSGAAVSVATANGALSTAIKLSGAAAAVAQASGVMTLGVVLSGAAIAQAAASGNLSASSPSALAGSASAQASATGAMSIQVAISGSAVAQAQATGALSVGGSSALAGNAQAVAAASGSLSVAMPLSGSAQVVAGASGNLGAGKQLAGAAVAVAAASGNLTATVSLSGAAVAQAIASGGLTLRFALSGAAIAHAAASGYLSGGVSPYVSDPRYTVRNTARNYTARARQRNFTVAYAN